MEWIIVLALVLVAVGYFCAGIEWERKRGYWRRQYSELLSGSRPCCGDWTGCRQPCTPRGVWEERNRSDAASQTDSKET